METLSAEKMIISNEWFDVQAEIEDDVAYIHGHLHITRWAPSVLKDMRREMEFIKEHLRSRGVKRVIIKSSDDYYRLARLADMWGFRHFKEPYLMAEI